MLWIVFIIALVPDAHAITKQDCPNTIPKDAWTQVHGNVCYRFELDIKKEYDDAQDYCQRRGGNLVTIKSKEINDFISNQLSHTFGFYGSAWIGLNDKQDEEHFVWEDGTPMKYNNFAGDSSFIHFFRHNIEDCVAIGNGGIWHDFKCSDYFLHIVNEHKRFICEFKIVVPKTTPAPTTTTTTTTTTSTTTVRKTTCPELICDKDCGMDGFKTDERACTICECNSDEEGPSFLTDVPATASSTSSPSGSTVDRVHDSTTKATSCKELECSLDCGGLGFKIGSDGCVMCQCNQ